MANQSIRGWSSSSLHNLYTFAWHCCQPLWLLLWKAVRLVCPCWSQWIFFPLLTPLSIHSPILKAQKVTVLPLEERVAALAEERPRMASMRGDSFQKCQHGRSHHWGGTKTAGSVPLATGGPAYSTHPGNWLKQSPGPSEPVCRPEKDGKADRLGEQLSAQNEYSLQLPRRTPGFVLNTLLTHSGTPKDQRLHESFLFRGQNVQQADSGSWGGRAWVQMLAPYELVKRDRSGQVASCLWATFSPGVEKRRTKAQFKGHLWRSENNCVFLFSLLSLLLSPPFYPVSQTLPRSFFFLYN